MFDSWCKFVDALYKNEGPRKALDLSKAIRKIALSVATNDKFEPLAFRKSNKEGIPQVLVPMLPLLRGHTIHKRLALTIIDTYKRIYLPVDKDLTTITSGGPNPWDKLNREDFSSFINS